MKYLSVCSGIEAASVAWHPLGWHAIAFAEIEKFPCAVLAHHYQSVPNWGDLTQFKEWPDATVDVLVGGTPCQSFSVAGLRKGLDDPRGNLALTYLAIADRYRPTWVVWENVPGVLSSESHAAPDPCPPADYLDIDTGLEDGAEIVVEDEYDADESHAFACFVAGLSELGYGFAYRVLDAQFFGVAQRRRRVFVVGHLGDWRRAAAVLFDSESLQGHPAPRRETREGLAPSLAARTRGGGGLGTDAELDGALIASHDVAQPLLAKANSSHRADAESYVACPPLSLCLNAGAMGRIDAESETLIPIRGSFDVTGTLTGGKSAGGHGRFLSADAAAQGMLVAHSLCASGFDASEDGTGRGTPLVPVTHALDSHSAGRTTEDGTGRGCPLVPVVAPCLTQNYGKQPDNSDTGAGPMLVAFSVKDHGADADDIAPTLRSGGHDKSHANGGVMPAVAFAHQTAGNKTTSMPCEIDFTPTLKSGSGSGSIAIQQTMAVRRLTPRECERLQGFPDDYTLIPYRGKPAADGPRYKALGNSMAVPVMHWIGKRIQLIEDILIELRRPA